MATFTELQTRVQQIVIDLPTAVTSQVPTLIRESLRRLQRLHDFKVAEAQTSVFVTAPATRTLGAVPSDFYKWRGKPLLINADGRTSELGFFQSQEDAIREFGTDAGGEADTDTLSGKPRFLSLSLPTNELGALNFEVWPFTDTLSLYTDNEYRIRVPYYKFLTALSGGSDTNWFTINADTWLVWDAAAEAFFLNWDETRGTTWKTKAAAVYKEVIDADKRLRFSEMKELVPHSDARDRRGQPGDFGDRWVQRINLNP